MIYFLFLCSIKQQVRFIYTSCQPMYVVHLRLRVFRLPRFIICKISYTYLKNGIKVWCDRLVSRSFLSLVDNHGLITDILFFNSSIIFQMFYSNLQHTLVLFDIVVFNKSSYSVSIWFFLYFPCKIATVLVYW